MTRERADDGSEDSDGIPGVSRRQALSIAGLGAGAAVLGGAGSVLGQQSDGTETQTETPTETPETDTGGGASLLDDLVDSVFGYPLAADETAAVSLEHVVDVTTQEGQATHPDFPSEPDEDAPGQFVEIPSEFSFDPVGLHVEPGDLVHFDLTAGIHTVTAFHEKFTDPHLDIPTRVPSGVPGFTSPPLTTSESWVYEFTEEGVYDYFCFPHLGLGMVGRIVVFDADDSDIDDETFSAPTAGPLFPNDERVLDAEELAPENIVDTGSVAWADLSLAPPSPTETATETETGTATETETGTATEIETATPTETEVDTPTETIIDTLTETEEN